MSAAAIDVYVNDELLFECPDAQRLVNPGRPGQVVFAGAASCYNPSLLEPIRNEADAEVEADDGTYEGRLVITKREFPTPGSAYIRVQFEFRSE